MSDPPHDTDDHERVDLAERILGFTFRDRELLRTALTHPSRSDSGTRYTHYERLEFLGDSVLGLLVTDHLFRAYPDLPEGRMTKVRSSFVSGTSLARLADKIGLSDAVIVGPGAESMREEHVPSLLADSFEAVLAAVYLDQGLEAARDFLFRVLTPEVIEEAIAEAHEDPKNLLQEHTQALDGRLPEYRIVVVDGPPHDRVFTAEVEVGGEVLGTGTGASKKDAQRRAAQRALDALRERGDTS